MAPPSSSRRSQKKTGPVPVSAGTVARSGARDRAGYAQPYTRNGLIASRQYADLETMREVARCSIDGRLAGDEPIRRRGPSNHEKRLALKEIEFEIAARTLVRLGYREIRFETGEKPDWRTQLAEFGSIGIEITEVNPSADLTNRVDDVEIELKDAIDAAALTRGRYVHTWFGPLAFAGDVPPATMLNPSARRELRDELLAWLASGNLASGRISGYPTLERFQITANVGAEPGDGSFEFGLGANTFSPLGAVGPTVARIKKKLERARGYDRSHPLWLILCITDLRGEFTRSVEAFGQAELGTGLFERIIVTDGRTTSVLEQGA